MTRRGNLGGDGPQAAAARGGPDAGLRQAAAASCGTGCHKPPCHGRRCSCLRLWRRALSEEGLPQAGARTARPLPRRRCWPAIGLRVDRA